MKTALLPVLLALSAATANAATFTVTNLSDSGAGSLRSAIAQANATPGTNTVNFAVTGTITLTTGQIDITNALNIIGPGQSQLTIDGNAVSRIFRTIANPNTCPTPVGVSDFLVVISGLTLRNGFVPAQTIGGAINARTSLTLDSVTIKDNTGMWGGGVAFLTRFAGQTLTITNSQFLNNVAKPILANNPDGTSAGGGALSASDNCPGTRTANVMSISGSTFSGNSLVPEANPNVHAVGGAIALDMNGPVTIQDTRIVDNHADSNPVTSDFGFNAGGIAAYARSLTIQRSEISGNSADFIGGLGVANQDPLLQAAGSAMQFSLIDSTISGNIANQTIAGVFMGGNVVGSISNSTVANNAANNLSAGDGPPISGIGLDNNPKLPTLQLVSSIVSGGSSSFADIAAFDENTNALLPFSVGGGTSLVQFTGTGITLAGSGNLTGTNPLLGPLAFNGGLTRTHALLASSPAIEAGSNLLALTTDQRGAGFARQVGVATDVGAYEAQPGVPTSVTVSSGSNQSTRVGTPFAQPLVALVKDSFGNVLPGVTVNWSAPASGASAIASGPTSTLTDGSGLATIGGSANSIFGSYAVTAQAGTASASFNLTNAISEAPGTSCGGNAATNADLVEHYYASILGRPSEPGGKAFWTGESDRLCGLGADVQQTFIIMANSFFNQPEYVQRNRSDSQFVSDLYVTFFGRLPEPNGLSVWTGQLAQGNPRNNVMTSFLLEPQFREFQQTMQRLFKNPRARAETYLVLNLYGGLFRRLADTGGYDYWTGQFRAAQCTANPTQAVTDAINSVSSQFVETPEYAIRNPNHDNGQYVQDLYYALLQRGADLNGYNYWKGQLDGTTLTWTQVRQGFLDSDEMKAQSAAIAAQGCL